MTKYDFDIAVIGSGPGGYVAAIRAAQLGHKVACIEKGSTFGGTCLNVGCIPSKALLQCTESYAWITKAAQEQGIQIGEVAFNFSMMMQRKATIVKGLVDSIAGHFKKHNIESFKGVAQFIDPERLEIKSEKGSTTLRSANFIIATGSESIGLPFLPFDEKRVVSSTGALSLAQVPKQMAIIGGGVIGVELASVYQRLGSQVSIVEMLERITPMMDEAVGKLLLQSLKKQGCEFFLKSKVVQAKADSRISLTVQQAEKTSMLTADIVLVAVGRRPYTRDLGLEKIGVKINPQGFVIVDRDFRTSQPHIYAIGDVIEGAMLAHRASHEGMAVAEIISGLCPHVNYISIPNVIYTHPEVAAVGLTEGEARSAGLDLLIGTSLFRGNARARCSGDMEGMVKVVADRTTKRLLGVHIIGPHASELIAEGMMALDKQATLEAVANACHAHPTLSEALMEACQHALGRPIHG